jgi:hypothetical protein
MANSLPLECDVSGKRWYLYSFEYTTGDGRFSSHFYAISDEHAHIVMQELKETAVLSGRVQDIIDAS